LSGSQEAVDFAEEWGAGYYAHIKRVSQGGEGTFNADIMHRRILDDMLTTPRWSHLVDVWGESDREELTIIWHNLDGTYLQESIEIILTDHPLISKAYQDTIPGLTELKRHVNILALYMRA
ncbi:hypothetical protein DFJ58DRAFT_662647, partial [Suillus subalutaceus]|uniref:uncharacterized protein n=1 Tax=Suillus subalutaceus TaxID=48586 RepID=UPI001B877EE1